MSRRKWYDSGVRGFVLVIDGHAVVASPGDGEQLVAELKLVQPPQRKYGRPFVTIAAVQEILIWATDATAAGATFEVVRRSARRVRLLRKPTDVDGWPLTEAAAAHFAIWFVDIRREGPGLDRDSVVAVSQRGSEWTINILGEDNTRRYTVVLEDKLGLPLLAHISWQSIEVRDSIAPRPQRRWPNSSLLPLLRRIFRTTSLRKRVAESLPLRRNLPINYEQEHQVVAQAA